MPQNPLSGRALSALTVVPDLQPTDRLAVLRPTAADPLDQNVTLTADRLQFALLATLTPVVLTALAGLLAAKADLDATSGFVVSGELPPVTFASTTGNPLDNPLLRALLLANGSGSITSTYAQAQAAAAATPATLQVGKFYLLTARPNDATTNILMQANTTSTFAGSEAYSQAVTPAGSPYLPVTYVFASDTVTARVVTAPITTPLTTNALRGGAKIVDFLTPFAAMAPYQVALSQMPLSGLAIGTRAFVQNPTPTPATGAVIPPAYFVLARCAANDPLAVSAFVNGGGGAVTLQTPAKWVRESTAEGQAAFFSMFDPAGRPGTNDYPVNYVVKYVENSRLGTYEATQYLLQSVFLSQSLAGIPAPGGTSNAYWRAYAPAVAVQAPYVTTTPAAVQTLTADPDSIQGILYHVLRGAAGDVLVQGVPTRAGATAGANSTPGGFSPIGVWCDPAATAATAYTFVDYNIATDTVVRRISGTDLVNEIAARIAADLLKVDKVSGSSLLANSEITRLLAITGTNTGDQNISGIATNAAAITAEVAARVAGDANLQTQATANAAGIVTNAAGITTIQTALATNYLPTVAGTATTARQLAADVEVANGTVVRWYPYTAGTGIFTMLYSGNSDWRLRLPDNSTGILVNNTQAAGGYLGGYGWGVGGTLANYTTYMAANQAGIVRQDWLVQNYVQATYLNSTIANAIAGKQDQALTGYAIATAPAALAPADTVLIGLGKLEKRISLATYTLPVATPAVLGGVKQGANVSIAADGTLSASAGVSSTDAVAEGTTNLYFTAARALATLLAGYAKAATNRALLVTDSVLVAFGVLEKKIDDNTAAAAANAARIGTATLATTATDLSNALNEIRNILPRIADRTTAAYTLVLADAGTLVGIYNTAAVTVTVPLNSAVAYPIGTVINLMQINTGQIILNPVPTSSTGAAVAGTVIIRNADAQGKSAKPWAEMSLCKRATDDWVLTGNTTT